MKKQSIFYYLIPLVVLLIIFNVSRSYGETLRGTLSALLAPVWRLFGTETSIQSHEERKTNLELENAQLRQLVQQELALLDKMAMLQNIRGAEKHKERISKNLEDQLNGVPAKVLYRSPVVWSSSLWIDVGEQQNIAKNSPVLVRGAVVGVIDYVGRQQSRVRLISDSGLTISVRAARGGWRDRWLAEMAQTLARQLGNREEQLSEALTTLVKKLQDESGTLLLAKGEIRGSSMPLWRTMGQRLKGIGFNYDFADEEGPARDLRRGVPEGSLKESDAVPILKLKDLLVTTGFDGIFPPGLPVGEVVKISPLSEGDYYYSLEAEPAAGNLEDINEVLVLAPVGFDKDEQPPAVLW